MMPTTVTVRLWSYWLRARQSEFGGFDSQGGGTGNFSLLHRCVHTGSRAHSAFCPMGDGGSSLGMERPGHESDHLPPSGGEVGSAWRYTSTPPIRPMA
jgi:hypothetical protein